MVQAIQGLKAGYEQAIKANGGAWPTPEQVAAAMHDVTFKGYGREVKLHRADGQGLEAQLFGVTKRATSTRSRCWPTSPSCRPNWSPRAWPIRPWAGSRKA